MQISSRQALAHLLLAVSTLADPADAVASPAPVVQGAISGPIWSKYGQQEAVEFGWSVSAAGDVDGDGLRDAIVGAWRYGPGTLGGAFVYRGTGSGLENAPLWTELGPHTLSGFGTCVAGGGDVNGDGFADVLVGAEYYTNGAHYEGGAFAYHGGLLGPSSTEDWFIESNVADARFGGAIASAGDVDGDGFDDAIVGAWFFTGTHQNEGAAFLYRGGPTGLALNYSWTTTGGTAGAQHGASVAGPGDVNGDGYDDVLVSASGAGIDPTLAGTAHLYLGGPSGLPTSPSWTFSTSQASSQMQVAAAGDVNSDGFADVLLSAPLWDGGEVDEGKLFVFFGGSAGLASAPDWEFEVDQSGAGLGRGISAAGDVNGDGFGDFLAGAIKFTNGQSEEGAALLFLGSACGPAPGPSARVEGEQVGARMGISVAGIGDVTADGRGEVLVGVQLFDNQFSNEGSALLYAGTAFTDCNGNGVQDAIDLMTGSADCNLNSVPDECDLVCGSSTDANANGVPDECESTITPNCFGDGTGATCPCGNTGDPGHGCLSSFGLLGGGLLTGSGTSSLSQDTLCLTASSLPSVTNGLLFQGTAAVGPSGKGRHFGDGLRCAGGSVVRVSSRTASAGTIRWGTCESGDAAISTIEPLLAPGVRYYQVWYRNSDPTFCTLSLFNLTNGVAVLWLP